MYRTSTLLATMLVASALAGSIAGRTFSFGMD
jgi:hypothetical protein